MKKVLKLKGLDCGNCAAKIELGVSKIEGTSGVSVNFMAAKLSFEADEAVMETVVEKIKVIVKKVDADIEVAVA